MRSAVQICAWALKNKKSKIKKLIYLTIDMSQENLIKLQCSVCKKINYYTYKNKKTVQRKIELEKYCSNCMGKTIHKETKK